MKRWILRLVALGLINAPVQAQTVQPEEGKGWWAFSPKSDSFASESLLDLRKLNETTAGEHGFIQLSTDRESFVRGDGEPIRFWGGTVVADGDRAAIDRQARFLAKRGVNMVRWHGDLMPTDRHDSRLGDINDNALDQLFYLVAAMKKEGIYLTVSPYWAFFDAMRDDKGERNQPLWPIPRNPDADTLTGLLFFDSTLQEAYKGWVRALLTRVNPYTGLALKDDPAVAIIQIQNEDSLLFWTFNDIKGADRDILEHQFGDWLIRRYGSLGAATSAWQMAAADSVDRPSLGMMALPNIYALTVSPPTDTGLARRYADTTQFLTETMYRFNAEITAFIHDELGAKQLVNPGNWRTASMIRLNDAERFSYTPGDVLAVNRYVTGRHEGSDTTGWALAAGDHFTNVSTLTDVASFPLAIKQVAGHPMLVTESLWVPPTAYESEAPFLVSAEQSLAGVDGYYWFSFGSADDWEQPHSANGFLPSVAKWQANSPMTLGQFPAAALMYRLGYIAPAKSPAIVEHRSPGDLWLRNLPLISEEGGFDPNRDAAAYAQTDKEPTISPLAYLIGPVKVDYNGAKPAQIVDLAAHIDAPSGTITDLTGVLSWNYRDGVARLDTPKAQGVTGFLSKNGGNYQLSDVRISSTNTYATVLIVSLDGLPLHDSRRILVQVGTQARPSGWIDQPAKWHDVDGKLIEGREIRAHGAAPWLIADTQVSISLDNSLIRRATALDANGMPIAPVPSHRAKDFTTTLQPDSLYVILE